MNSKGRLKRQGGEMSGRRPSTFDEAITFPLVVLAFGGAISSLMAEPERCDRCGHVHTGVCEMLTGLRAINVIVGEGVYSNQEPSRCGCPVLVPPKGES